MGILNSSIPNLLNGVSQQADALRNPTNCAAQTNAYPSPVEGLMKRHPTEFMTDDFTVIEGSKCLDTSSHVINRDTGEKYLVAVKPTYIDGGELEVWDLVNNHKSTVHYDQAAVGEEFGSGPTRAHGMIYLNSLAISGDYINIVNSNGVTIKFKFTTDPTIGNGELINDSVFVSIYQMTNIEDQVGALAAAISWHQFTSTGAGTGFRVTALHLGSDNDLPRTLGQLPTNHPLYVEGSTDETPGITKNILLKQDVAGVNGNQDMTDSTGRIDLFNFGENGLTAGADGDPGDNSAMESDPRDYLKAIDPATAFKFLTVGDVTYVVNTEREVKMHSIPSPKHNNEAMVTVKQGAYNQEYIVGVDGTSVSTIMGNTAGQTKTSLIASNLVTALNGGTANVYHSDIDLTTAEWTKNSSTGALELLVQPGTGTPTNSNLAFTVAGKNCRFTSIPGDARYTYRTNNPAGGYKTRNAAFSLNTDYEIYTSVNNGDGRYRITFRNDYYTQGTYGNTYYSAPFGWHSDVPSGPSTIQSQYTQSVDFPYMEFAHQGSNILMHPLDPERDFTLSTSDSVGNTYIDGFKERTQYLTNLPEQAPNGFNMRIDGDVENNIDDYYVTFKTRNDEGYGEGMWSEGQGPQIPYQYDYATMPHVLIRQADGSFLFKAANGLLNAPPAQVPRVTTGSVAGTVCDPDNTNATSDTYITVDNLVPHSRIPKYSDIVFSQGTTAQRTLTIAAAVEVDQYGKVYIDLTTAVGVDYANDVEVVINLKSDYEAFNWRGRVVGDMTTNPDPSFIGKRINNIFFYENRLGLLAGENCILSETGEFFNFFRTTIIDLLDTAPIDLAVSTNEIALLRHAMPYKGNLLLFSDNQQFALGSGRQALSNETVSLTQTSYDECNPKCNPVASGSSLYFGYDRGGYSGLRQMMLLDAQGDNYASADITEHVPQYIPNSWKMLASMPQQSLIIGLPEATDGNMQDLYLYKFMDRGNERVQSAWFKYSLPLMGDSNDKKQIIGIHAIDNILYILCQWRYNNGVAHTGGKTYLYKMLIENDRVDTNSIHVTNLDSRVAYDGGSGYSEGVGAQGMVRLYVPHSGQEVRLTDATGYIRRFMFTTAAGTSTGDTFGYWAINGGNNGRGTYVQIDGLTATNERAEEFALAVNHSSSADLKITAIQTGSGYGYPFTLGELPTTHPEYVEGSTAEDAIHRNVLLIQDVVGTGGNTDMTVHTTTDPVEQPGDFAIYNFGENGLQAGLEPDSRLVTASYDSPVTGKTTFTMPFTWSGSGEPVQAYTKAVAGSGGGAELTIDSSVGSAGTLVIDGDQTDASIWFGFDYTMTYEFSKPIIRGQAGKGSSILAAGRFQVLSCDLSFDDTTTFTATVTNPGRANDYTYTQLASSTDVLSTVQGSNAVTSGDFRIPIHTRSDGYTLTITSSSPFPVHFMSAEYEAQYNARSRRMSI